MSTGKQAVKKKKRRKNGAAKDSFVALVNEASLKQPEESLKKAVVSPPMEPPKEKEQKPSPKLTIGGKVALPPGVSAEVMASLSGGAAKSAVVSNGRFEFPDLPPGKSYRVTVASGDLQFTPPAYEFADLGINQPDCNFDVVTYGISGNVVLPPGVGGDVTVSLSGGAAKSALVRDGRFEFLDLPPGKSYRVTITSGELKFAPASYDFADLKQDQKNCNFGVVTYGISGDVKPAKGEATAAFLSFINDVTVELSGTVKRAATKLSARGGFEFGELPAGGSYQVVLTCGALQLDGPSAVSVAKLARDETCDFKVTTGTLKGTVKNFVAAKDADGEMCVEIGGQRAVAKLSSDGSFAFVNVPAGIECAVKSARDSFQINPAEKKVKLGANEEKNEGFGVKNFTISGKVYVQDKQGWEGVTVKASGARDEEAITDKNGAYKIFRLRAGGRYEVRAFPKNKDVLSPSQDAIDSLTQDEAIDFRRSQCSLSVKVTGIVRPEHFQKFQLALTGGKSQTSTLGPSGECMFSNLVADRDYTVALIGPAYYTLPAPLPLAKLTGNVSQTLNVTLKKFSVSGLVTNSAGGNFPDVTLTLKDERNAERACVSLANGSYQFDNVDGGTTYTVEPSYTMPGGKKRWTTFDPGRETLEELDDDVDDADFVGTSIVRAGAGFKLALGAGRFASLSAEQMKNIEGTRDADKVASHTVPLHLIRGAVMRKLTTQPFGVQVVDSWTRNDDTIKIVYYRNPGDPCCTIVTCYWV